MSCSNHSSEDSPCSCCELDPDDCQCNDSDYDHATYLFYTPFVQYIEDMKFSYKSFGSFRNVYGRGNVVIKIPRNPDGLLDNIAEAKAWRKYRKNPTDIGLYLAPCRLLHNNCLMMVRVNLGMYYSKKPEWSHLIDCNQVGERNGQVVAYDYALDLTERFLWEKESGLYSRFYTEDWLSRNQNSHLRKYVDT